MLPRLFHIGEFSLPTYGFMAALGLVLALMVVVRAARREGIDPDQAWNLGIVAILASMVGSKLLMIINDWDRYAQHPREIFSFATLQAAGVFYGGLIGAIIAGYILMRRWKLPWWKTADACAPGIALGNVLGRQDRRVHRSLRIQVEPLPAHPRCLAGRNKEGPGRVLQTDGGEEAGVS